VHGLEIVIKKFLKKAEIFSNPLQKKDAAKKQHIDLDTRKYPIFAPVENSPVLKSILIFHMKHFVKYVTEDFMIHFSKIRPSLYLIAMPE